MKTDEELDEQRWKIATIDAYESLKYPTGWLECPKCHKIPRVWIFDNGSFARCQCGDKYRQAPARSESIMSVLFRTKSTEQYSQDNLREAWNRYVETGERQTLPAGLW